jgi:hypothetical protein
MGWPRHWLGIVSRVDTIFRALSATRNGGATVALIEDREFVKLFPSVPGGPLAVPFRIIGKTPASCRGVK